MGKPIGEVRVKDPDTGTRYTATITIQGCACSGNNQKVGQVSNKRIAFLMRMTGDEVVGILKRKNERREKKGHGKWSWQIQYY